MNTYYLDAENGYDANEGTSTESAWQTLRHAGERIYQPGECLLLRRGNTWQEGLKLRGCGGPGTPISLGAWGEGPRPRINGGGAHAITAAEPIAGWHISDLELTSTNDANPEQRIAGGTCGVFFHQSERSDYLTIDDCLIHDTSGPGIYLVAAGEPRGVFRNVLIQHCEIYNGSAGIFFDLDEIKNRPEEQHPYVTDFFPYFRIAHVTVHDVLGDGIVPFFSRDGVIEHCRAYRTGLGCPHDHSPVAIWYAWSKRSVIQFCEAWDNHAVGHKGDGGGFDLDGGCSECVMQYNYSHDNDGAGFLICSFDPQHWPTVDCVTRYNLSVNDGLANDYSSILFWQADHCQTYNNTCITRTSSPLKFVSDTKDQLISNNLFIIDSQADIPLVKSKFDISQNHFRSNLYYRGVASPLFEVQGTRCDSLEEFVRVTGGAGERMGDPLFFNAGSGDVRLQAGSPARGVGERLPDIGSLDLWGRPLPAQGPVDLGCMAMGEQE